MMAGDDVGDSWTPGPDFAGVERHPRQGAQPRFRARGEGEPQIVAESESVELPVAKSQSRSLQMSW